MDVVGEVGSKWYNSLMGVEELDWRGEKILIRRNSGNHRYIDCDGFKSTPRELEVLGLKAEGLTHRQIGLRLSIDHKTSENCIKNLRQRNSDENGCRPKTMELINRAMELGLLNPYAVKGLESVLERI